MKRNNVVSYFLVSVLLCSLCASLSGCKLINQSEKKENWKLPVVFNAVNNGLSDQVDLQSLLKNPSINYILLDFWATWDKSKNEQLPTNEELFKQNKEKGLVVLGVSLDPVEMPKEMVVDYLNNVTFPLLWDKDNMLKEEYAIQSAPAQVLIDKNNQVVFKNESTTQEALDKLIKKVNELFP
jgi:peroxiredoxin